MINSSHINSKSGEIVQFTPEIKEQVRRLQQQMLWAEHLADMLFIEGKSSEGPLS